MCFVFLLPGGRAQQNRKRSFFFFLSERIFFAVLGRYFGAVIFSVFFCLFFCCLFFCCLFFFCVFFFFLFFCLDSRSAKKKTSFLLSDFFFLFFLPGVALSKTEKIKKKLLFRQKEFFCFAERDPRQKKQKKNTHTKKNGKKDRKKTEKKTNPENPEPPPPQTEKTGKKKRFFCQENVFFFCFFSLLGRYFGVGGFCFVFFFCFFFIFFCCLFFSFFVLPGVALSKQKKRFFSVENVSCFFSVFFCLGSRSAKQTKQKKKNFFRQKKENNNVFFCFAERGPRQKKQKKTPKIRKKKDRKRKPTKPRNPPKQEKQKKILIFFSLLGMYFGVGGGLVLFSLFFSFFSRSA